MPLWDENQASDYLGKKPTTLQQWRWLGYGPTYLKIGRNVRYDPDELKAWAHAQRRTNTGNIRGENDDYLNDRLKIAEAKAATKAPA